MGAKRSDPMMDLMLEGSCDFAAPTSRPLNRTIIEYLLRKRYGKGASPRGLFQLILGSLLILLMLPNVMVAPLLSVILGVVSGSLFICGILNIRDSKPNELKISKGDYFLRETTVIDCKVVSDGDAADSHIFLFADGEEIVSIIGDNSDWVFYNYGKKGDKCYLLFFDSNDEPDFVFDSQWWVLQPDLECLLCKDTMSNQL